MTTGTQASALAGYAMALGDDALVLAHRCGQWVTRAPQLEEDVALANIGLDLLGQARTLLSYAGEVEGAGRDEDDLAYLRDPSDFRNVLIVEQPNGDFAVSMARLLLFGTYQRQLYERLSRSADDTLAAVAAKAVKEVAYHVDHAASWVVRLGDGTVESHRRMQAGLATMWPYVEELFAGEDLDPRLVRSGVAVDPAALRPGWDRSIGAVLREATLQQPAVASAPGGGRLGRHGTALTEMLATMQKLHRAHPGATW